MNSYFELIFILFIYQGLLHNCSLSKTQPCCHTDINATVKWRQNNTSAKKAYKNSYYALLNAKSKR